MNEIENQQPAEQPKRSKNIWLSVVAYFFFILSITLFILSFTAGNQYCFDTNLQEILLLPLFLSPIIAIIAFYVLRKNMAWVVFLLLIIILAAIGTVSLSGGGAKAKDAQIKSDLNQIAEAQELYYDDFGSYAGNMDELHENYLGGDLVNPITDSEYRFISLGNSWAISSGLYANETQLCERFGAKKYYYTCTAGLGVETVCTEIEE